MSDTTQRPISAATRICAVLGHPIRHSASPAMHNPALAALGLDWRYVAFDVHPDQLREAIEGARTMRFVGLNLTVPHKLLALPLVDELDDSAWRWGAVNTIRFEARGPAGNWQPLGQAEEAPGASVRAVGFNTDADAIVRALKEDLGLQLSPATTVLLLGAGGAARAAALRLAAEGTGTMYLVNRTPEKARALADELRKEFPQTQAIVGYPQSRTDLVLNATSAGLKVDDPLPFDPRQLDLRHAGALYDMIYRPVETPLLKLAKTAGCRTANGLGMLLYQGAKALELWSGKPAPVEIMRRALSEHIYA